MATLPVTPVTSQGVVLVVEGVGVGPGGHEHPGGLDVVGGRGQQQRGASGVVADLGTGAGVEGGATRRSRRTRRRSGGRCRRCSWRPVCSTGPGLTSSLRPGPQRTDPAAARRCTRRARSPPPAPSSTTTTALPHHLTRVGAAPRAMCARAPGSAILSA